MSKFKLEFHELTGIAAGVPLHTGNPSLGRPAQVPAFSIQAKGGDLLISDAPGVGSDIGITLTEGNTIGWGDIESRGTDMNYDLTKIYVKGPGSAILALEVESN